MTRSCWKPAREKYGVAICCFNGSSVKYALSLDIGDTVQILEEFFPDGNAKGQATWLRGCLSSTKDKKGIFPATHVYRKECTVEHEGPFEVVTPVEDAIIKELTYVLREWNQKWKNLFVKRQSLFQTVQLVMGELAKCRSKLVSNTLTKEQAMSLKHEVVTMIDWGNGQLGMDLVPRVEYCQADPENVSVVEMFRIHERSVKNCQGAWPGGMVKVKAREEQREVIHHLLVSLCSFACSVGDKSEVMLHLYDNTEGKMLSERAVMWFNTDGQRASTEKSNNVLFMDLSSDDMKREIYLVVQIFRKGCLIMEGSFKKVPHYQYRRPWGVSVLNLKDLFQIKPENDLEYFLRVHCSADTDNFHNLHEVHIRKQTALIGKNSITDKQNLQGVTLSLKILDGDLKSVKVDHPILFNKGLIMTQRMGFPDFINPGESRNDLYLTLCGALFDKGNKKASKNVEVRVTVYNQQYEIIQGCILGANGERMASDFFSYVLYHNNGPKWNETIRLSIPNEKFNTSHIRFELSHCSNRDKAEKKLYGFAFLSVTLSSNVTRLDGKYDLIIYKCEDSAKIKNYLNIPCQRDDFNDPKMIPSKSDNLPYAHSRSEYLTVETFLVSSKFTQKSELINIFQWVTIPEDQRATALDNLCNLRGQELVRYLQSLLDALFGMLVHKDGKSVPYAMNIFHTFVHLFYLVQSEFEKFKVVLENYLENTFSSPLAYREILYCLQQQAEKIYTCTDFDDNCSKKIFKVVDDMFKFAVKSCMFSIRMVGDQALVEFRTHLNRVFEAFGRILQCSEKELNFAQCELLKHLHQSYIPLLHIISAKDLAQLVLFVSSRVDKNADGTVLRAKTTFIKNFVGSTLMFDPEARVELMPLVVGHLKKCMYYRRNLDLTANTLGDLLSCIFTVKQTSDVSAEVTQIIRGLFERTVRTLLVIDDDQRKMAGSLLVSSLTEMLRLMDQNHYKKLISEYPKPKPLRMFLLQVLLVFQDLVRKDDFPHDWTTMRMITNNVMLTAIQYIAHDLTINFNRENFDRELWDNFFILAVDFITQPALQLEAYSEAKSSQIRDKYNDMRVPVGYHIQSLWNDLGDNKQHMMLDMIGPFLKVTMIPQEELRRATIPIFFDIIQCEFGIKKHLKRLEGRMIHELDSLVIDHHGDAEYTKLFHKVLLDKVQAEPELQEEGKRFVFSVTDLLERLLDYRETLDREEQRDAKMHTTFNILNLYKLSREDMYIRYISRLYELHLSASNFVEAGLTLRLYAQLLKWSAVTLPAEMSYPSQTETKRKEDLLDKILDCFDKGKAWEYGLPLCKDLAAHYETTFQYDKLSRILQKQAAFLGNILQGELLRHPPSYYRVVFYGNTLPQYVKNKAFIYRGDECLKLADLMQQLTTEYPTATILSSNEPVADNIRQGDAQYIQIVNVHPVPVERPEFQGRQVPNEISAFYQTNEVDTFRFDRPFHREPKDKASEFKTLCFERTTLTSTYKLPGILRWYEVKSTEVKILNPLQVAMEMVKPMTMELKTRVTAAAADPDNCLRTLTMRLQGVIQGLVNGGIVKIHETFFNDEYISKHPDEEDLLGGLKEAIFDQLEILNSALNLHGKLSSTEVLPLHTNLVEIYRQIRQNLGYHAPKNRGSVLSYESQRPSTPSSHSYNSSGSNRSSVVSAGDVMVPDEADELYGDPMQIPLPNKFPPAVDDDIDPISPPPPIPKRKPSAGKEPVLEKPLSPAGSRSNPGTPPTSPPPRPPKPTPIVTSPPFAYTTATTPPPPRSPQTRSAATPPSPRPNNMPSGTTPPHLPKKRATMTPRTAIGLSPSCTSLSNGDASAGQAYSSVSRSPSLSSQHSNSAAEDEGMSPTPQPPPIPRSTRPSLSPASSQEESQPGMPPPLTPRTAMPPKFAVHTQNYARPPPPLPDTESQSASGPPPVPWRKPPVSPKPS